MPSIHGIADPRFDSVAAAFHDNFQQHLETGAAVCVYHHGRKVVDLWAGSADPDRGRAWSQDTLQVIYSATKGAVAACAHLLVQRGLLDLDAPVAAYWPQFAAAGKDRIPVRWLLSHQAGLPALDTRIPVADALEGHRPVEALAAQTPVWIPGAAHGYHAMTYGWLIAEIVRRISGRDLGTFFRDEIAVPLGLDFWIGLPKSELNRVSRIITPAESSELSTASHAPPPDIVAAYSDPNSLTMRAVIPTDAPLDLNRADQQTAQIPAVNGICTAGSLARFYSALVDSVDGVRILPESVMTTAASQQVAGFDQILRTTTRFGLGFSLPTSDVSWWTPTVFGHAGHGGSLACADPGNGLAFGYVMNRLNLSMGPDTRAAKLLEAAQDCTA